MQIDENRIYTFVKKKKKITTHPRTVPETYKHIYTKETQKSTYKKNWKIPKLSLICKLFD